MIACTTLPTVRAIVIDDELAITSLLEESLKLSGINVVGTGHDGKTATEMYQKLKPDIVFLDLIMPEFDGFYGLEKIKQTDPGSKVIIITGSQTQQTKDRLTALGADMIIYKPIDIVEILVGITRMTYLIECAQ